MVDDPRSTSSLRKLVLHLLLGRNYRLITEVNTKHKLFVTYAWLSKIYEEARKQYGDEWRQRILSDIIRSKSSSSEKDLIFWLLGLTRKTAQNLDISPEDFPEFLLETIKYCNELYNLINFKDKNGHTWLLLMAGAATLNIRGSQKSLVGKSLERVLLKVMLTALGLKLNDNFWVNVARDAEVERETDAEVETKRGRIRIDIGLIAQGNPEVITDKISRVGRNGVVIFDRIGLKAKTIYQVADSSMVKLIQIRHNLPLIELYRHIKPLVKVELAEPPSSEENLLKLLNNLSDELFIAA